MPQPSDHKYYEIIAGLLLTEHDPRFGEHGPAVADDLLSKLLEDWFRSLSQDTDRFNDLMPKGDEHYGKNMTLIDDAVIKACAGVFAMLISQRPPDVLDGYFLLFQTYSTMMVQEVRRAHDTLKAFEQDCPEAAKQLASEHGFRAIIAQALSISSGINRERLRKVHN